MDLKDGLSIITGETGAGKSILLGGLALVLGKRADATLVYDKKKKCIIEAEFDIGSYELSPFFETNDLDYDSLVIIRRELLPGGKSRAFVNDTPTNLSLLNELTEQLIDVHSQHETLQLSDPEYQFHIIDSLAKNQQVLKRYSVGYRHLKQLYSELNEIKDRQINAQKEYDYNVFVWNELEQAKLKEDEQEELERDLEKLSHVEEIKEQITGLIEISEMDQMGVLSLLANMDQNLSRISGYDKVYGHLSERFKSSLIEIKDIIEELYDENDKLIHDPSEQSRVERRLEEIYHLQKKHAAASVSELLDIKENYESKIIEVDNAEEAINNKQIEITAAESDLNKLAGELHQRRSVAVPQFIEQIQSVLGKLEMKNTRFKIELVKGDQFLNNGKDQLSFLMSSDKGKSFEALKRVASGGEMSRMMLGIKFILSKYSKLPAIVFDEIDTGVSGEVSNRIAELMKQMSKNMQVVTITHLPQVAAKGQQHYKVFKEDIKGTISSNIKLLSEEERLVELAEMLGGSRITESAIAHAKQLLS
jgi:DNA repair protein RecN (Recombination protein N)